MHAARAREAARLYGGAKVRKVESGGRRGDVREIECLEGRSVIRVMVADDVTKHVHGGFVHVNCVTRIVLRGAAAVTAAATVTIS